MKALVLAGGSGTRLRPVSDYLPKQLVPIANRPVLEYVLDNIRALGVREVGVIVGDRADAVSAVLGDGSRFGLRIVYIHQEQPLGLAHTVLLARPFLGGDDFVMYLGDVMLLDGVAEAAEEFARQRPSAHVVVRQAPDPRPFGVVELGAGGIVRSLVEKPVHPRGDTVLTGVYFFTSTVHEAVSAIPVGARGELEITDAVQWLVHHGHEVRASRYSGYWKDTGRLEDVLCCNREILRGLPSNIHGDVDADSQLTGAVMVGPGSRVIRSKIDGPAVIGSGTVIQDSRVGPHTSIGDGCSVNDCELADTVVMQLTSMNALVGLRGSVIGDTKSTEGRSKLLIATPGIEG